MPTFEQRTGIGKPPRRRQKPVVAAPQPGPVGHVPTPAPQLSHPSHAALAAEHHAAVQVVHHLVTGGLTHLPQPSTVGYAFHHLTDSEKATYGPLLLHRYVHFAGSPPEVLRHYEGKGPSGPASPPLRKAEAVAAQQGEQTQAIAQKLTAQQIKAQPGSPVRQIRRQQRRFVRAFTPHTVTRGISSKEAGLAGEIALAAVPAGAAVDALRLGGRAVEAIRGGKAIEEASKGTDVVKLAEKAASRGRVARTAARARRPAVAARAGARAGKAAKSVQEGRKAARAGLAVKGAAQRKALSLAAAPAGIGARGALGHIARDVAAGGGPIAGIGGAVIQGHAQAIADNPLKTLQTTTRAVPGILTYPLTVGGDVAVSAGRAARTGLSAAGLPGGKTYSGSQIADPLKGAANEAYQGLRQPAETFASGDPARIQKAVENQYGLSFAVPIPALSRLHVGERTRGVVGKVVGHDIPSTREVAKRGRKSLAGRGFATRHAPAGHSEHIFGFTERRATRKRVAAQASRSNRFGQRTAHVAELGLLKPLRKSKLTRGIRHRTGLELGDAVQLAAEYGLSRDPALLPHQLEALRAHLPHRNVPDRVTGQRVLDFFDQHPEAGTDPHFWQAVDNYKHDAANITTSERARLMSQGDLFGIQRPEHAVPHSARALTTATDRAGAHRAAKRLQDLHNEKRSQARAIVRNAEATGPYPGVAAPLTDAERAQVAQLHAEARAHGAKAKALRKALRPYTAPGVALRTSLRTKPWDRALLQEYANKVNERAAQAGFEEPAFTHHAVISQEHVGTVAPPHGFSATRVQHVRTAGAQAEIDRSLRELVSGSVYGPRQRRAGLDFTRQFVRSEAVPIEAGGKQRVSITRTAYDNAVRGGQLSGKHYVFFPARWFKQAVIDPNQSADSLMRDLANGVESGDPGEKGIIVSKEAAKEFKGQVDPNRSAWETWLNASSKGFGRVLLGLSPGWALAQLAAEGLPVAVAHNPARLIKGARAVHQLPQIDEQAAHAWAAMAGETPAVLSSPSDLRLQLDHSTNAQSRDFFRALEKNRIGRATLSTVQIRPLGLFDRWKGGKYRSILAAAEVDKRLNGFLAGMQGMMRSQRAISEELAKKPLAEQIAWVTKNPQRLQEIEHYLNDVMGNWTAFTRFEREFAPAAIFYSFLRYSFRWMFWTFPKRHPIKATMLYFLGQQNAQQLQKFLGAKPANWQDYGNAILHTGSGGTVGADLPVGTRITPGLNAVTQAVGGNNPAGLISGLNPALGIGITGATNVNPLSGNQSSTPNGVTVLNQLLALPPPARFFPVKIDGQTSGSKAYSKADPQSTLRSVLMPYLPLDRASARERNNLLRSFNAGTYSGGSSSSGSSAPPWKTSTSSSSSAPPWKQPVGSASGVPPWK